MDGPLCLAGHGGRLGAVLGGCFCSGARARGALDLSCAIVR
ncbi:hypothetical protein OAC57_02300 [Planktomarina temperata]|nr:hypothetical protein [Planktomarina temperata]